MYNQKNKLIKTIVFFNNSSDLYGTSVILLNILKLIKQLGYNPILLISSNGPLVEKARELGVDVHIVNLGILRRKYFNISGVFNRGLRFIRSYLYLRKLVRENNVKLIYSNTLGVLVGAVFCKIHSIPHIWHIHERIDSPKFLYKFLAKMMDSLENNIAVSNSLKEYWDLHVNKSKLKLVYNGIDYTPYLQQRESVIGPDLMFNCSDQVVTMIGRINPGKGQLFFLDIAEKLLSLRDDVVFLMIGDPYPGYEHILEKIETTIKEKGLESKVFNLGYRKDIPDLLNLTDVFVLPSILPDSFPTVILEAMASGLPVVATKSGGAIEMVSHNNTGYLIDIEDVEAGTFYIDKLLDNKDLRDKFGSLGRERVLKNFSLENFNSQIKIYLNGLIR